MGLDLAQVTEHGLLHPQRLRDAVGEHSAGQLDARDDLAFPVREHGERRVAKVVQEGEVFVLADAEESLFVEYLLDPFVFSDVADGEDQAEIERDGFFSGCNATVCECVLVSVTAAVVGLAGYSSDARYRGEEDEEIKTAWEKTVEVPCTFNFWPHGNVIVLVRHGLECCVLN